MRPRSLEEFVGQGHLLGPGRLLTRLLDEHQLPSLILWGPPGCGKTTLARLLAEAAGARFVPFSAVLAGLKEVREAVRLAQHESATSGRRTVVFIDEIHRFNKAQQDAFLPHVEAGTIVLLGATTENPSFEVISPLLSRAEVAVLHPLTPPEIRTLLERSLRDPERGLGRFDVRIDPVLLDRIAEAGGGDARRALSVLERAVGAPPAGSEKPFAVTAEAVTEALFGKSLRYDAKGEEHYNVVSAFIKSMRGSDPDAALYWLARMLEAGEDPLFVARRMVILASEDIGNADPAALSVAVAAMQAFDFVGMPEGWIPLAQAATYLATAPKSNASYRGYVEAREEVRRSGALPVPMVLRNAPTRLMQELGYGKGYLYPHDVPSEKAATQKYLPEEITGRKFYRAPASKKPVPKG